MSGGSWDYVYGRFVDVGIRLRREGQTQARKALGELVCKVSEALHAIEWNDSGDGVDNEDELIRECFSGVFEEIVLREIIETADATIIDLINASNEAKMILSKLKDSGD